MSAADLKNPRRRVVGAKASLKQVTAGRAQAVFVARDTNAKLVAALVEECGRRGVPVHYEESMARLGVLCGIEVGAAAAAVLRREAEA